MDYLKGIDDFKYIEKLPINIFTHRLVNNILLKMIKAKEARKILPNIKFFKKHGENCAVGCSYSCSYCFKCAIKLQKFLQKKVKQKDKMQKYTSACAIN